MPVNKRSLEREKKRKFDKKKQERRQRRTPIKPVLTPDTKIDYKNIELLHRAVTPGGRILSRRFTGATTKQQRELTRAVKKALYLSLIPVGSSKKRF